MVGTLDFDLDTYFARIGFSGEAAPDLQTLRAIHALHPGAIAFESLDPWLQRPVRLDLASIQAKLVADRRGGYCFEQNALLRAALEAIGFRVTGLIVRVCWMAPPERPPAGRSHMLLRVDLAEGVWLADVGFGGHLSLGPVRLEPDLEQDTGAGRHRLQKDGEVFTLQTRLPAGWQGCYQFTLEPAQTADYEISSWFTSTHPDSLFRNALLAERLTAETRFSLNNHRLTLRHADGRVEERALDSAEALGEALETALGIRLPVGAAEIFERLPPVQAASALS